MKKIKDFTAKDWFQYYSALNNEKPVEKCGFDLTEEQKAVYNRELEFLKRERKNWKHPVPLNYEVSYSELD